MLFLSAHDTAGRDTYAYHTSTNAADVFAYRRIAVTVSTLPTNAAFRRKEAQDCFAAQFELYSLKRKDKFSLYWHEQRLNLENITWNKISII